MRFVVIGGKGTAVNIAEQIVDAQRRWGAPVECLGFAIDDPALGGEIAGLPVVCGTHALGERLRDDPAVRFLFALYRPDCMRERVALFRGFDLPVERIGTFVHPSAYVSASAVLGPGTVVLSQATIQSRVRVGAGSIVNSGCVLEHEAAVAGHAFVAANATVGARVALGEGVFVGLGAAVREDVRVGDYAFVGMAANVLHDVPAGAVAYGNPARVAAR